MIHIAIANEKHQLCYKFLISRVKSIDLVPERNGELRPRVKLTDSLDQSVQPLLLKSEKETKTFSFVQAIALAAAHAE